MKSSIRNVNFIERLFSSLIIEKDLLIDEISELKEQKIKISNSLLNTNKENFDDYLINILSDYYFKLGSEERLFLYHYFLISNVETEFELSNFNSQDSKIPKFLKIFILYNIRIILEKYLTHITHEIETSRLVKVIETCKNSFFKPLDLNDIYLIQVEEFYREMNESKIKKPRRAHATFSKA